MKKLRRGARYTAVNVGSGPKIIVRFMSGLHPKYIDFHANQNIHQETVQFAERVTLQSFRGQTPVPLNADQSSSRFFQTAPIPVPKT